MQNAVTFEKPSSTHQKMLNPQDAAFQTSSDACLSCGVVGSFCAHCGKPHGNMMQTPFGCPTCGVANFCAYCGLPTARMQGVAQQKAFDSNYVRSKPGTYCADPMLTMSSQFGQPGIS